jgi:hypothetical protein
MAPSSSSGFYQELPFLAEVHDMVDAARHAPVPPDWLVAVADIEGSTKAIAAGRYKEVNMVSAAAITAVLNAVRAATGAVKNDKIAYVFGGDGATFLVPPDLLLPVAQALHGTQQMAREDYGLALRAGAVPVGALAAQGAPVSVAKSRVSEGLAQAVLSGAGIGLAETWVKDKETGARFDIAALFAPGQLAQNPPDFSGLSCRWEPLRNRKGLTLSLIVLAAETRIYCDVLAAVGDICGVPETWRPLAAENMRLTLSPKNLSLELKTRTHGQGAAAKLHYFAVLWGQTLAGKICLRLGLRLGGFDGGAYRDSMMRHTDYIKFDNALRLVMDITPPQKEALAGMLEERRAAGRLYYGMHAADAALMTCLAFDLGEEHFHFIDGANGGYALAAVQLKRQLAAAAPASGRK